ncbi:MAG: Nramp family divalent metal transporter [Vicinamibacteraceae bacterium]
MTDAPHGPVTRPPPRSLSGTLAQVGPGLILTASIVGSGELIVVPKLGADVGFSLLWFVIVGCLLKVFVQIALARYSVATHTTTLAALDGIPGPRWRVSWVVWVWLGMYVGTMLQLGGIIGGIASVCAELGLAQSQGFWVAAVTASCALLLLSGRYRPVERWSTVMVGAFTLCTIVAVVALQWTPYRVTAGDLAEGLSFSLPPSFTVAFAAFGITGVGASELVYYPYWCLEKGYGRQIGPRVDTAEWRERARGWLRVMQVDAWCSLAVYTAATAAFYVLGATVLHARGTPVTNDALVPTLAHMYGDSLGAWSTILFLVGAFVVLYSTFFVSTAGNARLLIDVLGLARVVRFPTEHERRRGIQWACVLLPLTSALVYTLWPRPVTLVIVGAIGQGVMLPFLAGAALYFHRHRATADLRPGPAWGMMLWISALLMIAIGIYQLVQTVRG